LEIATKSVEFFRSYFNTAEPVPPKIGEKSLTSPCRILVIDSNRFLDLLAVPNFSTGAMENWGLIAFREDRLIFDEKVVSILQKQQLVETIAHELAHFCKICVHSLLITLDRSRSGFGNYVTCKWWDDLWLNEAMATWLSYKLFTLNYPEWNLVEYRCFQTSLSNEFVFQ
jgi:aminopeptidase N